MPSRLVQILTVGLIATSELSEPAVASSPAQTAVPSANLESAQRAFYNGRYEEAAALTSDSCASAEDLAACELRSSALLFRIKRAVGQPANKEKAWRACAECPGVMQTFLAATASGQAIARTKLKRDPADEATLFFLGKLDLNYVWLQLGILGRRTGWGEYWEARHSLDSVLRKNPGHVRARVARAWIDYIVDTKMPRGTRWLLGGGNKKRGFLAVREAANTPSDFFAQAEAAFALWDMQVRERELKDAVSSARALLQDFPENAELRKFIETHGGPTPRF